jgi:hypothetical protein
VVLASGIVAFVMSSFILLTSFRSRVEASVRQEPFVVLASGMVAFVMSSFILLTPFRIRCGINT